MLSSVRQKSDNSWIKTTKEEKGKQTIEGVGQERFKQIQQVYDQKSHSPSSTAINTSPFQVTPHTIDSPVRQLNADNESTTSFQPIIRSKEDPIIEQTHPQEKSVDHKQEVLAIEITAVAALIGVVFEGVRICIASFFK